MCALFALFILLISILWFLKGILWAGRGQVRKSLLYLLSVKNMYQGAVESSYDRSLLKKTFLAEIDSIYTHNLFYLAQAYGKLNDSASSFLTDLCFCGWLWSSIIALEANEWMLSLPCSSTDNENDHKKTIYGHNIIMTF